MRRGGKEEESDWTDGGGENLSDCWRARLHLYYYLPAEQPAINFHGNVHVPPRRLGGTAGTTQGKSSLNKIFILNRFPIIFTPFVLFCLSELKQTKFIWCDKFKISDLGQNDREQGGRATSAASLLYVHGLHLPVPP